MSKHALGDELFFLTQAAIGQLFSLAELAQLAHEAFAFAAQSVSSGEKEELTLQYPLGVNADGSAIVGSLTYSKADLVSRYSHLANVELGLTAVYHLISHCEMLFGALVRSIVLAHPRKPGSKRTLNLETVLSCDSIEGVHAAATETLIRDLLYKSPRDFADAFERLTGIKLLER